MSSNTQISIEDLAVKLNGKMWSKGDLKRIYLDRGHNTKKMSTKTYVYERNGEFFVSCKVECPSKPYEWCDSQENLIIERVQDEINEVLNPTIQDENEESTDEPAVCSPEYDIWRQKNIIDHLPELTLEEIRAKEIDLDKRLFSNATMNYLSESIHLDNLRRRIFVGKKIEEVVEMVKSTKEFVPQFTVACIDGVVKMIENIKPYHGISNSKGMDLFMIETNSNDKYWKHTPEGFHKFIEKQND